MAFFKYFSFAIFRVSFAIFLCFLFLLFYGKCFINSSVTRLTGSGTPIISTITQNFGTTEPKVFKEPVYRFVPQVGFTNYNKVSYQPPVELEVPSVIYSPPAEVYGPPLPLPPVPAKTYGIN